MSIQTQSATGNPREADHADHLDDPSTNGVAAVPTSPQAAGSRLVCPFEEQGHYTVVHDAVFDVLMRVVPNSAFKIIMLIIRQTRGWKKDSNWLTYDQIRAGTGIKSDTTVSKMLGYLERNKMILVRRVRRPDGRQEPTWYALNTGYWIAVDEHGNAWIPEDEKTIPAGIEPTSENGVGTERDAEKPTPKNGTGPTPKNGDTITTEFLKNTEPPVAFASTRASERESEQKPKEQGVPQEQVLSSPPAKADEPSTKTDPIKEFQKAYIADLYERLKRRGLLGRRKMPSSYLKQLAGEIRNNLKDDTTTEERLWRAQDEIIATWSKEALPLWKALNAADRRGAYGRRDDRRSASKNGNSSHQTNGDGSSLEPSWEEDWREQNLEAVRRMGTA